MTQSSRDAYVQCICDQFSPAEAERWRGPCGRYNPDDPDCSGCPYEMYNKQGVGENTFGNT